MTKSQAQDHQALAAAMHEQDSLEDGLLSMTMPCCRYVGKAEPRFAKVQECVQQLRLKALSV